MIDWKGWKVKYANAFGGSERALFLLQHDLFANFPAILAQHEQDQRAIEAAKDALKKVRDWVTEDDGYSPELMIEREAEYQKKRPGAQFINTDYMAMLKALAEFDKVKP